MIIEILFFLLLGILAGTFTGLVPGIHINLVGAALVSGTFSILSGLNPLYLAIFIVSMSIAHVFLDFIPSIFLGAPEEGTELSVLPGHEMLKRGQGLQAVHLAATGCLYGIALFILMIFPLYFISLFLKNLPGKIIALGLIAISLNMIFLEKRKFYALLVFLLTGALGFIVFNMNLREPLLPLLSGLFGASGLVISIGHKTKINKQETKKNIKIKKLKVLLSSAIVSPLSLFLPALSSGQIAIIGNQFAKTTREQFLFMLGIVTMIAMCLSFLGLFLISKTRTGSAAAIKSLLGVLSWKVFFLMVIVIFISGLLSFFILDLLSKKSLFILEKINYSKLSMITLAIVTIITFFVSGAMGLLVFIISMFTGIFCITSGVKRTNMIGCLLVPTIILYLF
jgi:putative membrane protein